MIKTKFKLIAFIVFSLGIVGAGSYFLFSKHDQAGNTVADSAFGWKFPVAKFPLTGSNPSQIAYSDIRDPGGIPEGLPVRLNIPTIGVDSAIEDALITPDGRMDVPVGSVNVAWFSLGPHPGKVGSAVIGGHFGIKNGIPFVFYNLDKLVVGDKIYIVDDRGDTIAFVVRVIKLFNRDADATTVFTSEDGLAHLNLITCEGIWNQVNDTYPDRRVVFTDLVPREGATGEIPVTTAFYRPLGVGAEGVDVAALQTVLEQKGFLTMPFGVAYGFFGSLTRAAVAKYQLFSGISPPAGYFGPLTRARMTSELVVVVKPKLPTTAIGTSESNPPYFQTFVQSAKSLYRTPLDGLITSMLLLAVVFMAFKIIRQLRKNFARRPR